MKRVALVMSVLFLMGFMAANAFGGEGKVDYSTSLNRDDINYEFSPLNKLGRGIINVASCWAEIPAEAIKVTQEKDPFTGATLGVAEGTVTAFLRGVTGVADMLTFFAPPYNKPAMKPEYALKSADDKFKEYFW